MTADEIEILVADDDETDPAAQESCGAVANTMFGW